MIHSYIDFVSFNIFLNFFSYRLRTCSFSSKAYSNFMTNKWFAIRHTVHGNWTI